jgi:hypothetical protein
MGTLQRKGKAWQKQQANDEEVLLQVQVACQGKYQHQVFDKVTL